MSDFTAPASLDLPLWAQIVVAALALAGAAIAFVGSLGLWRLKNYFERVHAPAVIATLGCWLLMHASWIYFSLTAASLVVHVVLIAVFVAITVPITTIFLMRAALFRARRTAGNVPRPLSSLVRNEPAEAAAQSSPDRS